MIPEDVQAAELTELLREADAVAYSLREFLNQPTLAETVDDLASRLAAETARADAAEEALAKIGETARWYAENDQRLAHEVDHALCVEILSLAESAQ